MTTPFHSMKYPIRYLTLTILFTLLGAGFGLAEVVRPAPGFSWVDGQGRTESLNSLRGQPAILLVARSPRDRHFRAQVKQLERLFRQFSARETAFFAAFSEPSDQRIDSNIPFARVNNGAQVVADYGFQGQRFGIAVIGPDGNLDSISKRVQPPQIVRDVIDNSYQVQESIRP